MLNYYKAKQRRPWSQNFIGIPSLTRPHQAEPLRTIVERFWNGNPLNTAIHSTSYDDIDDDDYDFRHPSIQRYMDIADVTTLLDEKAHSVEELKAVQQKIEAQLLDAERAKSRAKATETKSEEPEPKT